MIIPWIFVLQDDDQALVRAFAQRWVVNGPTLLPTLPFWSVVWRKAMTIGPAEYLRVRNRLTGEVRNEIGPKLFFMAVDDELMTKEKAIVLQDNEYIRLIDQQTGDVRQICGDGIVYIEPTEEILQAVTQAVSLDSTDYLLVRDRLTGELRNEKGPKLFFPAIEDEIVEAREAIALQKNEYMKLIDKESGNIRLIRGECTVYLEPSDEIAHNVTQAVNLDSTDYLLVRNRITGELRNEKGPQLFFPTVDDEVVERRKAIVLQNDRYVRLVDNRSGVVRVLRGERIVFLEPTELAIGKIVKGIHIDDNQAVLVRNTDSGQLELIAEPQVFVPSPTQQIVEVRHRVRLEDNEAVIIKDIDGQFQFRRGDGQQRAFFLDPHSELVEVQWSSGIHKERRDLKISKFDLRPKFMWYEFEARTQDNVELVIGITFFWEIADLQKMIRTTDDTPGDICSHARSAIIQAVSQVSLEQFLAEFNHIIRVAVLNAEDAFYAQRGVILHAVEVRSVRSKDKSTQQVLQEIINETTQRINRLQKQESENEVALRQMEGQIETERQRGELLRLRREHAQAEGLMVGEAEAVRVKAFLDGLGEAMNSAEKLHLFNTLRKQDALQALSSGNAQLYFTPNDVDLTIRT